MTSIKCRIVAICLAVLGASAAPGALGQVRSPRLARPTTVDKQFLPVDGVPPGHMVIEGDIIVPNDFFERGSVTATFASNTWPGGIVPYEFNTNVSALNQTRMFDAMAAWESRANIHFVPRAGEGNYLFIQNSNGNSSFVGRVGGGQSVNIFNWTFKYIIAHELAHALGFWHEQSRSDRDAFVSVNLANIQSGRANNFNKITSANTFGPYDFDSIMHYGRCAFSICCPLGSSCSCSSSCETITVLPPNDGITIGQRTHLSTGDAAGMAFLYGSPVCSLAQPAQPEVAGVTKNRYLGFRDTNVGTRTGVRVTLANLPAPWDAWNGRVMWVGQPRTVTELSGSSGETPGPTFTLANLQCEPYFESWDLFDIVYVTHAGVVPGGQYELQVISNSCDFTSEASFSPALVVSTAIWGDTVGAFDSENLKWLPPDGGIDVVEIVAVLSKFAGKLGAPLKVRADIQPSTPDQVIDVSDILGVLQAFEGGSYPFTPGPWPCP